MQDVEGMKGVNAGAIEGAVAGRTKRGRGIQDESQAYQRKAVKTGRYNEDSTDRSGQ